MLKYLLTAAGLILGMAMHAVAEPRVVGYYATWEKDQTAGVDLAKYTHINIAFGAPTSNGSITYVDEFSMSSAVSEIHNAGAKALLSIGGWAGSYAFSDVANTSATRTNLVSNIITTIRANSLDGIDIDWEYPGRAGDTCNTVDEANDTPNFLLLLRELRTALDTEFSASQRKSITMAVRVQPFDVDGVPLTDVSEFAKLVDFANLMIYDINGAWMPQTGPNAPFDYENDKGTPLTFITAIDAWTNAGWPASQLNAGLAFYGRSTTATVDMTLDPANQYQNQSSTLPQGDIADVPAFDACANVTGITGTWQYKNLRGQGILTSPTTAAAPWIRRWDDITQTPWLYNPKTRQYITYDDPLSIKVKIDYAAAKGVGGAMVWALYMDYQNELLNTVHTWGQYPMAGAACTSEGTLTCKDMSATSPDYLVCLYGLWLPLSCNPSTVCLSNRNSIVCGWPRHSIS
ncbi:hypothetical protein GGH98_000595 [Coemansia sp. RSA 454]|nr:hypothetical protein GGH98_000595 [Coemansia sp. RSA 454]